jgi:hydroxyacylglutathione hydrolase
MIGKLIDVRQVNEYSAGHVPGAVNVELGAVTQAALKAADTTDTAQITFICGHGERAMTGASIVAADRAAELVVYDGGPETWSAATGRPLELG